MTWSYINQLAQEGFLARTKLSYKLGVSRISFKHVALLTLLVSNNSNHRVFASGEPEDILKALPIPVMDYCSSFELTSIQTKQTDFSFVQPARYFLASLQPRHVLQSTTGNLRYWLGALSVLRDFCGNFLKTRRMVFLKIAVYNPLRLCYSIWRVSTFLGYWPRESSCRMRVLSHLWPGYFLLFSYSFFIVFCRFLLSRFE